MHEQPIRILDLDDDDEMQDRFYASVEELTPAMDLTVRNPYAEISNVVITEIAYEGSDVVQLYYEFDWHVYMGCDDHNQYDTMDGRRITGTLVNGYWVFPRYVRPEPRSTHEEF